MVMINKEHNMGKHICTLMYEPLVVWKGEVYAQTVNIQLHINSSPEPFARGPGHNTHLA
jgi:hypothetical protein